MEAGTRDAGCDTERCPARGEPGERREERTAEQAVDEGQDVLRLLRCLGQERADRFRVQDPAHVGVLESLPQDRVEARSRWARPLT